MFLYHPDHLATGAAALAAVYPDARNAFAPELDLPVWAVPKMWQFGGPADDRAVDVTDVFGLSGPGGGRSDYCSSSGVRHGSSSTWTARKARTVSYQTLA